MRRQRWIALLIFAAHSLPLPLVAAEGERVPRATVVVPVRDGNADRQSHDLTLALRDALQRDATLHLLNAGLVEAIVQYHDLAHAGRADTPDPVDALVAEAKSKFLRFDTRGARVAAERAVAAAEQQADGGGQLVEALLTMAMTHQAMHDQARVAQILQRVARIAPTYALDPAHYPPSVVAAFRAARSALAAQGTGHVRVESAPPTAQVTLNGVSAGVTPLDLHELPAGRYRIGLTANRYRSITEDVAVRAGATTTVHRKLQWTTAPSSHARSGGAEASAPGEGSARAQVSGAVRVGEVTGADRVVAVDVDERQDGAGTITVRCVDRALQAGQPPIRIAFDAARQDLHANLARMTTLVSRQLATDLLHDPRRATDPVGAGSPILLGRRRHRVSPIVWGAVGAGVVGGVLAAIFAGQQGSGAGTGAIQVSFR